MIRLISYLAPSIPAEFFALVARHIESSTGVPTSVTFEKRISGPLEGDDDPFADGRADVGFVCAPSVRFLGDTVTVRIAYQTASEREEVAEIAGARFRSARADGV